MPFYNSTDTLADSHANVSFEFVRVMKEKVSIKQFAHRMRKNRRIQIGNN